MLVFWVTQWKLVVIHSFSFAAIAALQLVLWKVVQHNLRSWFTTMGIILVYDIAHCAIVVFSTARGIHDVVKTIHLNCADTPRFSHPVAIIDRRLGYLLRLLGFRCPAVWHIRIRVREFFEEVSRCL